MQSQAIVFAASGRVETRSIAMPTPEPGEVQVRTRYSLMSSGTEGWVLQQCFTWATIPFPCVPGYQRVGEIIAVGEGVTRLHPGERVVATNGHWSGDALPNRGAHIALANTLATEIYTLPAAVDDIDASGVVVAQVGYNAASRVALHAGDWVVVYGDGLIRQCAAQALRARQARVILVGHRQERLTLAKAVSTDAAVVNTHRDALQALERENNE